MKISDFLIAASVGAVAAVGGLVALACSDWAKQKDKAICVGNIPTYPPDQPDDTPVGHDGHKTETPIEIESSNGVILSEKDQKGVFEKEPKIPSIDEGT